MVKHWPSTLIMSVVQVSKQRFMSMITLNLHVQVAQLCTSSISSSSFVFNLTALAFWTVQMGLQSGLTQVKPVQGCAAQTNNFLGEWDSPAHRSDNVLSSVSSFSSTTKRLQDCISTNCTFHEEWNGTCIYTEITESCFVVRRSAPPRASSCLPFPILCQTVSVGLVKSVKLGQQSPNL